MSSTILILTEEALQPIDVSQILALFIEDDVDFAVLVPAEDKESGPSQVFDALWLGEFDEVIDAMKPEPGPDETDAEHKADRDLRVSLTRLTEAGARARGHVIGHDPIPAVLQAVTATQAEQLIVVTKPHFLEDAFHRDWASRADRELQIPVLHLLGGAARIVD